MFSFNRHVTTLRKIRKTCPDLAALWEKHAASQLWKSTSVMWWEGNLTLFLQEFHISPQVAEEGLQLRTWMNWINIQPSYWGQSLLGLLSDPSCRAVERQWKQTWTVSAFLHKKARSQQIKFQKLGNKWRNKAFPILPVCLSYSPDNKLSRRKLQKCSPEYVEKHWILHVFSLFTT